MTGPGIFYDLTGIRKWFAETFYMSMYFYLVKMALGQDPLFGSNFAIRADIWREISSETHLARQDIHDDMEISFHVVTKGTILFDRELRMPISPRPFNSFGEIFKRIPMGLRSIFIHWPQQAPWRLNKREY